jgi:hypothetical protein
MDLRLGELLDKPAHLRPVNPRSRDGRCGHRLDPLHVDYRIGASYGGTRLCRAAEYNLIDDAEELLMTYGADPFLNVPDWQGPVGLAYSEGHIALGRFILDRMNVLHRRWERFVAKYKRDAVPLARASRATLLLPVEYARQLDKRIGFDSRRPT